MARMAETRCDHECAPWWSYHLKELLLCSDSTNRRHKFRAIDSVFKKQYMYILFNIRLYIYIYTYIKSRIYIYTHTHIFAYLKSDYIYIYVCVCVCVCVCSVSDSYWVSTVLKRTEYVTFAPYFYFSLFFLSDGWLILVTTGASCHHSTKQGQQVF
jgi:hypothetical protein